MSTRIRDVSKWAVVALIAVALYSCGGNSSTAPAAPTLTAVSISGIGAGASVGQVVALAATATFSDNSTSNVTTQAAWTSSNLAVATVSATGVATFVATGEVDLKAAFQGKSGSTHVTVAAVAPTVTSVSVTGIGSTATIGQTAALVATATFSNSTTSDVTSQATWNSSNTSVATVTASGLASFVGAGGVDLQATFQGASGATHVTVSPPAPVLHTLSGTVTDASNGNQPLAGVTVQILDGPNAGQSTQTGANGGYSIGGLNAVSFTVQFSKTFYTTATRSVTLSGDTRVDVGLSLSGPNVSGFYGTFNVALSIVSQVCSDPFVPPVPWTGTLALSGNPDGSGLSAKITERAQIRPYSGGVMNTNGTFNGNFSGFLFFSIGRVRPLHDVSGSIQGTVSGNNVTGTENLTYGAGCPGGTIVIAFTGAK